VVLAVILYCCNTFSPTHSNSVLYESCRTKLHGYILGAQTQTVEEQECLVWVAAILVSCWTTSKGELDLQGITCLKMLQTSTLYGLSWQVTEVILCKFFWSDKMSWCFQPWYSSVDTG